jgi:hypothetical protein
MITNAAKPSPCWRAKVLRWWYDTAFVPVGKPHRFINDTETAMAMTLVYAGSGPERTLVAAGYCAGTLIWTGPEAFRKL